MNNTEIPNSLDDFKWDNPTDEANFFAEFLTDTDNKKSEKIREDVQTEDANDSEDSSKKTTEENLDVFSEFMDSDEEKEIREENQDKVVSSSVDLFNSLRTYGLFKNIELEENEEIDDERIAELLEEDYELEVNQRVQDWATVKLDEEARAFISFKQNGGNTQDFFKMLQNSQALDGDITDVDFQKKIIIDHMRKEDLWTDDEILDRIDDLEESGKLEVAANKYYSKYKEKLSKERENLIKQQEEAKIQALKEKRDYELGIRQAITDVKEIKGFRIHPKEKNGIYNFIISESEQVGDRKVTGFQKAIAEVVQDPQKLILLAKLLKSDFDLSSFEKSVKSKEIKKLKETLESRKGLRPTNSSRNSFNTGKSLSELFQ